MIVYIINILYKWINLLLLVLILMIFSLHIGHAQAPEDMITQIFWSPDASQLALIYHYGHLEIYDGNTFDLLYADSDRYSNDELMWSPDGAYLALSETSSAYEDRILIFNTQTYNIEISLEIPENYRIMDMTWSPDGTKIAATIQHGYGQIARGDVRLWDVSVNPPELLEIYADLNGLLIWSPDGEQLLLGGYNLPTYFLNAQTFDYIDSFDYSAWSVAWSPDGTLLALLNETGIQIWDAATFDPLKTFFHSDYNYFSILWSPDGSSIVTRNSRDQFEFWDIASGQLYATLEGSGFNAIAWHPDGAKIAHSVNWTEFVVIDAPIFCHVEIEANDAVALINTITTANNSGDPTTICLAEDSTYSFDTPISTLQNDYYALPKITGNITIEGNGATLERVTGVGRDALRFFNIEPQGSLTLHHLSLADGGGSAVLVGGAIKNDGTVSLNQVTLTNNYAENGGGAIYNAGTLTINASVFAENGTFYNESGAIQNKGYGGAIYNTAEGIIQVTDTQFTDNQASFGGTIYNRGDLTFTQSSIEGSQSGENAGAIYNDTADAILSIMDSQFTDNQSRRATGGALVNIGGEVTITGSTFSGNQSYSKLTSPNSGHGGGAIAHYVGYVVDPSATGTLSVSDSIFTGNSSMMSNGGAILVNGGATVDNSCISGNSNTSVYNILTTSVDFSGNWWGAANGPSGVGSGSGDSVGANIPYTPFLTASTCPLVP